MVYTTLALSDADWSRKVRERGNDSCCWIGCSSRFNLGPHHVFGRGIQSTRLVVENGILLCQKHHERIQGASKEKKERLSRLLIGNRLYDKLEKMSRGVYED